MTKILLALSGFLLFSYIAFSQNYNQVDGSGQKQGKWVKKYGNGNTRYEGQFTNDRPYGTFTYFFSTGEKEAVTNFSDDGVVAHTTTYYKNGYKRAEGKYLNQKKDSLWHFFSEMDGKLVAEEFYQLGKLEGVSTVYYPETGKIAETTEYHQGLKSGKQEKYFDNGSIWSVSNFINDVLHGEFTSYYPNGSVQVKGDYENGLQAGEWVYFDEEGKTLTEEQYKEQKPVKKLKE